MTELGIRYNEAKVKLSLLCSYALEGCARVLMFGMDKYDAWNWAKGQPIDEVIDSLERHLAAIKRGELIDEESGLPHVDHLQCNTMFLSSFHHRGMWDALATNMPEYPPTGLRETVNDNLEKARELFTEKQAREFKKAREESEREIFRRMRTTGVDEAKFKTTGVDPTENKTVITSQVHLNPEPLQGDKEYTFGELSGEAPLFPEDEARFNAIPFERRQQIRSDLQSENAAVRYENDLELEYIKSMTAFFTPHDISSDNIDKKEPK